MSDSANKIDQHSSMQLSAKGSGMESGFEATGMGGVSMPPAASFQHQQSAANNSPQVSQLKAIQRNVNQSTQVQSGLQLRQNANQGAPLQMVRNVWNQGTENAINQDIQGQGLQNATPQEQADGMLNSDSNVFWYGADPSTDEQVEITAGANYLAERKQDWQAELQNRQDVNHMAETQSWEAYQAGVANLTQGEAMNPPWFLNPNYGYNVNEQDNAQWIQQATQGLNNPDQNDPQEIMGATYDRDTGLTSQAQYGQNAQRDVNGGSDAAVLNGTVGHVFRLFNDPNSRQATNEVRFQITDIDNQGGNFIIHGTVIPTHHFPNGGFNVGSNYILTRQANGSISLVEDLGGGMQGNQEQVAGWSGKLEASHFYNAVTVAEDSLGVRYGAYGHPARNRGAGEDLNDATATELRDRYANNPNGINGANHLALQNSLGPSRNRLNIQELGWGISVAQYRRLGGDLIFNEAHHPNRDPNQYSNLIQPAANVDITNGSWFHDSQEHNPDRFVGGRSNSTFLYLKTASILYQRGDISLADAMDVMAFVIADMVVSGEHSMPECMSTVVMAAENSPPWNATALNIQNPQQTLNTWLHLVDDGTEQAMYNRTRNALIAMLQANNMDYKLFKSLVSLGKVLWNDLH